MKRPATAHVDSDGCRKVRRAEEQVHTASVFAWPSIAAVPESLPFWVNNQQPSAAIGSEAVVEQTDTDISLSLWEQHQAASEQLEISLRCYGSPDVDSDAETEDTATSSSSGSGAASQEQPAVLQQGAAAFGDYNRKQLDGGDDDSITSSSPHKTFSAAFSFGCLPDRNQACELGWFAAIAAVSTVAAQ